MGAGGIERLQCLTAGASRGEGGERTACGFPGANRAQEADPCLLGDIAAVAAAWQAKPGHDCADQWLVAAQELVHGSTFVVLRRSEQRVFVM